jgi:hypothetical protein
LIAELKRQPSPMWTKPPPGGAARFNGPVRKETPAAMQLLNVAIVMVWILGVLSVIGSFIFALQEVEDFYGEKHRPFILLGIGVAFLWATGTVTVAAVLTWLRDRP